MIYFDRGGNWWRISVGNAVLKWRCSMPQSQVGIDLPGANVYVTEAELEAAIVQLVESKLAS